MASALGSEAEELLRRGERSVLGSWVGVRRLFHLSLFLAAYRVVLPEILVLPPHPLATGAMGIRMARRTAERLMCAKPDSTPKTSTPYYQHCFSVARGTFTAVRLMFGAISGFRP